MSTEENKAPDGLRINIPGRDRINETLRQQAENDAAWENSMDELRESFERLRRKDRCRDNWRFGVTTLIAILSLLVALYQSCVAYSLERKQQISIPPKITLPKGQPQNPLLQKSDSVKVDTLHKG